MKPFFYLHPHSSEVSRGDSFSVFVDGPDSYWVVSNNYPCVYSGSFDLGTALKIMNRSNENSNYLNSKGIAYYD